MMDRIPDYESGDIGSIPIRSIFNIEKEILNGKKLYG